MQMVKLSNTPWRRIGGVEVWLHAFLTSALDGGEWSALRPGRFTSREKAPSTHWIGGWVGSRAVLDAVVKRKIPSLRRESNPRTPVVQPVVQHYTDWAIMALCSVTYIFTISELLLQSSHKSVISYHVFLSSWKYVLVSFHRKLPRWIISLKSIIDVYNSDFCRMDTCSSVLRFQKGPIRFLITYI
jgi:hypothetical protein